MHKSESEPHRAIGSAIVLRPYLREDMVTKAYASLSIAPKLRNNGLHRSRELKGRLRIAKALMRSLGDAHYARFVAPCADFGERREGSDVEEFLGVVNG